MAGTATGGAGWPTADQLETVAPGRRAALWAHDHHALWASHAALASARPAHGRTARRRDPPDPRPARPRASCTRPPRDSSRSTSRRWPRPTSTGRSSRSPRTWCRSASSPATTRAASRRIRSWPTRSRPMPGWPMPDDSRCASTRVCATTRSKRRSSAAIAAASGSVPIRMGGPSSAGRSASPTDRSDRGPPPCSRTSNRSRTVRSRPTVGAACG